MSKTTKTAAKPSAEQAVKKAVKDHPGATAEGIASAAGIGRSTASKALARLREAGQVTRFQGGRDGNRRLPDRFALAGTELPAARTASGSATKPTSTKPAGAAAKAKAAGDEKPNAGQPGAKPAADERLKPGQLDGLVLAYLKENADTAPHAPTAVAKALERSSGAVGNCLVRLTEAKKVRQVSDKPRRYSLAA
jgi:hypothetical protein